MEWININDQLPENSKNVLICHSHGFITLGWLRDPKYYTYRASKWDSVSGVKSNVTHWMPLPAPPISQVSEVGEQTV